MREQLRRSRETIEERIGMPVEAISIPYGRWNDRVLEACARSGYRRLYTSDPWLRWLSALESACGAVEIRMQR